MTRAVEACKPGLNSVLEAYAGQVRQPVELALYGPIWRALVERMWRIEQVSGGEVNGSALRKRVAGTESIDVRLALKTSSDGLPPILKRLADVE